MAILALPTLRPNGQGTLSSVNNAAGATTNLHLDIDDDPDAPDTADYVKNATDTNGDKTAFFLFDDMPADFKVMNALQVDCHIAVANFVNDTCTLFARMYKSDEVTVLTDEVQVATQAQTGLRSISFTNVVSGSKTDWDGARLRLRWNYARVSSADSGQLRVNAVELDGTYSDIMVYTGAASIAATSTFAASGAQLTAQGAATIAGTSALTATSATKTTNSTATIAATSGLTAAGVVWVTHTAAASISATSSITAAGVVWVTYTSSASITATSSLAAGPAEHVVAAFWTGPVTQGVEAGEGYGGTRFGASTFGGGAMAPITFTADTDEEIAGHEIGGTAVNINAMFPIDRLPMQPVGCGNGFAGGPIAALLYGGGVPCNGFIPSDTQDAVKSNVEEFCIIEFGCAS